MNLVHQSLLIELKPEGRQNDGDPPLRTSSSLLLHLLFLLGLFGGSFFLKVLCRLLLDLRLLF